MIKLGLWALGAATVWWMVREPAAVLSTATGSHPAADAIAHAVGTVTTWSMDLILRLLGGWFH